jgi:hypothetical protein
MEEWERNVGGDGASMVGKEEGRYRKEGGVGDEDGGGAGSEEKVGINRHDRRMKGGRGD